MEAESVLFAIGGVGLSALSFVFGRIFAQSENILDRKREAYSDFLKFCPAPNEAHFPDTIPDFGEMQRQIGTLTLYGSPDVCKFAGEYFEQFSKSNEILVEVELPEVGHPEFLKTMTSYNQMIWAMRNDAMTWSVFAPKKSARTYRPSIHTGQ